jgi:predicted kinase
MPTAHLIHGFLGAGKTTLARRLEAELGAVRFSPDEWMSRLYGDDPPAERFADMLSRVYAIMDQQWPLLLARGLDVVLDYGFWTRASRDHARAQAIAAGARSLLYWVRCGEEVARARCRARNADLRGSLFIADATFDLLKNRFEPLGPDEPFELVETG